VKLPEAQKERLLEKLKREVKGPLSGALNNPEVIEIVCNANGSVWQLDRKDCWLEITKLSPAKADSILSTVAALTETGVSPQSQQIQCVFPLDGSRFQGLVPPAVDAPTFDIRKHSKQVYSLESYILRLESFQPLRLSI